METVKMLVVRRCYMPRRPGAEPELLKGTIGDPIEVLVPAKITRNGALIDHPEYPHLVKSPPPAPVNPVVVKKPDQGPPMGRRMEVDDGGGKKGKRAADV
jgi:hypothetical protein